MNWLDNLKELRARVAKAKEVHNFELISQADCDYECTLYEHADRLIECADLAVGIGSGEVSQEWARIQALAFSKSGGVPRLCD